jgi:hypothetical protein
LENPVSSAFVCIFKAQASFISLKAGRENVLYDAEKVLHGLGNVLCGVEKVLYCREKVLCGVEKVLYCRENVLYDAEKLLYYRKNILYGVEKPAKMFVKCGYRMASGMRHSYLQHRQLKK